MSYDSVPSMAPVFPLANCVLFPKVLLPMRIFEPRYKLMLQDVIDSPGWIVVALSQTDRERDDKGNPDIFPVAGLGRVVDYQRAADGTYKIVLLGEHRVRIKEWTQLKPYAIASIEKYPELEPEDELRDDIRGRLRTRIREVVRHSMDSQVLMLLDQIIKKFEAIGPLVDFTAHHFLSNATEKQRLLEISDAVQREQKLLEILVQQRQGAGEAF